MTHSEEYEAGRLSVFTEMRAYLKEKPEDPVRKAAPAMLAVLRDVAALLPSAGRLHPKDLHALQTRVCEAVAKAEGRS